MNEIPEQNMIVLTVPERPEQKRLDAWLASETGFSRSRIQSLISEGFVAADGITADSPGAKLKPGTSVSLTVLPDPPAVPGPQNIPLSVIFEDDSVIVIDKPAGIVTHPAPGHPDGTIVNAILHHCGSIAGVGDAARPGIVHRLDCDTSGALVIAKTQIAAESLIKQFQNGDIRKTYMTLVHGIPEPAEGRIETLIGRHSTDRKKMAVVENNGKTAVTNYKILAEFPETNASELEVKIETGRTHQIRVHMKYIGCPVLGDGVYGSKRLDESLPSVPARQCLHAHRIEFNHPVSGKRMIFESPLPEDIKAVLAALR